jgi:hypothetical protein
MIVCKSMRIGREPRVQSLVERSNYGVPDGVLHSASLIEWMIQSACSLANIIACRRDRGKPPVTL